MTQSTLKLYNSKKKVIPYIVFLVLFIGICAIISSWFQTVGDKILSVVLLTYLVLALLRVVIETFGRRPVLEINPQGIHYLSTGCGLIPWKRIKMVWVVSSRSGGLFSRSRGENKNLSIEVLEARSFVTGLTWFQRVLYWNATLFHPEEVKVNEALMDGTLEEMVAFLKKNYAGKVKEGEKGK